MRFSKFIIQIKRLSINMYIIAQSIKNLGISKHFQQRAYNNYIFFYLEVSASKKYRQTNHNIYMNNR